MQAKIVLPNEELEYGAAEAIKTLRTNIMYSEDVKAIMLTSTMPSEGKSTVSLELARSFCGIRKEHGIDGLRHEKILSGETSWNTRENPRSE